MTANTFLRTKKKPMGMSEPTVTVPDTASTQALIVEDKKGTQKNKRAKPLAGSSCHAMIAHQRGISSGPIGLGEVQQAIQLLVGQEHHPKRTRQRRMGPPRHQHGSSDSSRRQGDNTPLQLQKATPADGGCCDDGTDGVWGSGGDADSGGDVDLAEGGCRSSPAGRRRCCVARMSVVVAAAVRSAVAATWTSAYVVIVPAGVGAGRP